MQIELQAPGSFFLPTTHPCHSLPYCWSVAKLCQTLCDLHELQHARLPCLSLPEFAQIHVHWVGYAIQPSKALSSPSPPALKLSQNQVFPNELALCIKWPKFWSFSTSPSNEYSGLISFKIDWFDLLAVQGTLKSLLQRHSLKASILWWSAFFMVQLSHLYMTTGKTIALTIWIFVSKVMSLLFNTLSSFVIAFLPRSNCLLISWLQSPFSVILEPKKRKSVTSSFYSPSTYHEVIGPEARILVF